MQLEQESTDDLGSADDAPSLVTDLGDDVVEPVIDHIRQMESLHPRRALDEHPVHFDLDLFPFGHVPDHTWKILGSYWVLR